MIATLGPAVPASAQDKPRYGGELVFVVAAEPPGFDAHREETFGMLHPGAPHYNTLMRVDPFDKTGTKFIGDLAESWTVSADKRTYTFKLRQGVKFHDGSVMTSRDVKASYDKIIFPPAGVVSSRQAAYRAVEAVEAPSSDTVVFRLKWPEASFIANLSSPWNWIYKADILAKDPHWYEKNVMGTGPFKFVEYVRGSHWVGKKNPDYWDKGKPYLDGYRAIFIQDAGAQVAAIRGERAMIQFRGFTPAQRDTLVAALGSKITVQESPWNCSIQVAMNQQKKPFDDKRVRRALTLALDRWEGSKALSRIAVVKDVAGIQVPGTPWATPPDELVKLAGYGHNSALLPPTRATGSPLRRGFGLAGRPRGRGPGGRSPRCCARGSSPGPPRLASGRSPGGDSQAGVDSRIVRRRWRAATISCRRASAAETCTESWLSWMASLPGRVNTSNRKRLGRARQ
jgi:peptide/nickel transport system substrate-binding protein